MSIEEIGGCRLKNSPKLKAVLLCPLDLSKAIWIYHKRCYSNSVLTFDVAPALMSIITKSYNFNHVVDNEC